MSSADLGATDLWTLLTIAGLTVVTVVARSFFFMSSRPWQLPPWAQRGLQYAPIAALSAVVVPEVVMSQGHLVDHWQDARVFAALAGAIWFYWQRRSAHAVFGTIMVGMAVYLPLHVGLGW